MKTKISETLGVLIGTLFFQVMVIPIFFAFIPYKIVSSPNHTHLFDIGIFRYLGWASIFGGVVIYFWCSHSFVFFGKGTPMPFSPTKKLLVTGLYRFVRNPMYLAALLVLAGETLLFQSRGLFIYCLILFGVFHFQVLALEEPYLKEKFGDTYKQYCKAVRRWIPRRKPYYADDLE